MKPTIKERPLLLSAPMARSVLAGHKTQTRRIIKPQPERHDGLDVLSYASGKRSLLATPEHFSDYMAVLCPYGRVGDRLWVREAWRVDISLNALNGSQIMERFLENDYRTPWIGIQYESDGERVGHWPVNPVVGRYRHARFMPRWASRLTLEITDVRVQRLQEISEEDAQAEGVEQLRGRFDGAWKDYTPETKPYYLRCGHHLACLSFATLWQSIHGAQGADSWGANPWVWAISFARVDALRESAS